jgi:alkyl sulfatase BDS1-like metallo-beta-lactamase superfamily hydrolase
MALKHIKDFPVKAVLLTHSHVDHFLVEIMLQEDIKTGKIKSIALMVFLNIPSRKCYRNTDDPQAAYMYGNLYQKNNKGSLGPGLGTTTAKRRYRNFLELLTLFAEEMETKTIDGVKVDGFILQNLSTCRSRCFISRRLTVKYFPYSAISIIHFERCASKKTAKNINIMTNRG